MDLGDLITPFDIFRTMETFLEGVSEEEVATVGMTSQDGDSDQPLGKESSQVLVLIFVGPFTS